MLPYLIHFIKTCEDSINKFIFYIYYGIFVVSLEWEVLAFAQRQPDKAAQPLSGGLDSDAMADLIPCDRRMSRRGEGRLVLAPGKKKKKSREAFLIRVVPVSSMASVSGLCRQLNEQKVSRGQPKSAPRPLHRFTRRHLSLEPDAGKKSIISQ